MMQTLYSKEISVKKKKKAVLSTSLGITSLVLLGISLTLFIVFSSYEKKTIFMVVGSIVTSLFALSAIYFFIKRKYQKDELFLYDEILEEESTTVQGKIISMASSPITLSDSSYVYSMVIEASGTKMTLYLPYFVDSLPEASKEYTFEIVSDRVKGYEEL